jgi:hypothetical protein
MRRKTIVSLVIGLLLALTLSLSAPSASAHTSSYCYHGHSGSDQPYTNATHYSSSFWEHSWHFHVYKHYLIGNMWEHIYAHTQQKVCQVH